MTFDDTLNTEVLSKEFEVWSKGNKTLRFGQYICNKYLISGKSAPEIFYAENVSDAYWLIVETLSTQEI